MARLSVPSPVGELTLEEREGTLVRLSWGGGGEEETALLREAALQIKDYFARRRESFELPLAPEGEELAQAVWRQMLAIPYGRTYTYGEIAKTIGSESPQAVGQACGANPLPILIPCHRVLAAGGAPGGYSGAGGLETKAALLRLEGYILPLQGKLL